MKRTLAIAGSLLLLAAPIAHADEFECFPLCEQQAAAQKKLNLCESAAVREVARVDQKLKPVKQVYDIATNPAGYAIKLVSENVVHIPPWLGYAMDPRGAIRAKVIERVRDEVKKEVGLRNDCAAEIRAEDGAKEEVAVEARAA